MRLSILLFLGFVFIGFLGSCTKKVTNPLQYEKPKVTFGNGGGFAGVETSYMMLDNGKIFKMTEMGQSFTHLGQIDRNKVSQFFETFKLFTFDKMVLNDPGNMYKYIEIDNNGMTNRLTWGNSSVDKNLTVLYQILMNNVSTITTKK